jgi:Na+-translocating ferredoxin:NAD+ oxidoreductase RnfD subunit
MLAMCLLAYLGFHSVRFLLPDGFIRSSLPSALLMPVMLGVTDLFESIRYYSFGWKVLITLAATIFATIWFEWIVPEFATRSTSDLADVAAMFIGWLFYICFDLAQAKRI